MLKENLENQLNLWKELMSEYKASGKTQAAWCEEKNINLNSFYYWNKKLKKSAYNLPEHTSWVPVKIEEETEKSASVLITIKIGNASIELPPGFDEEHLGKILKVLNVLC